MSTDSVTMKIKENNPETPFLLRVIWFFVFGWELTGIWILVAWALNASIIGLPLGLWMIDRVPQVLTLKARPGVMVTDMKDGRSQFLPASNAPFLIRAAYFVLFGWWFSLIWALLAYLLCATIIGLPLGVMMLNGLPAVTTLVHS
ncbi:YccF domain-containing protein [Candidatus Leptofilum sp.]|uniref:YccF domain-containing protein n=1 Tax=Candidatus Leptofilum sp. TaxID=3241576 RepID=UPI003B5B047B